MRSIYQILALVLLELLANPVSAQLDSTHWISPFHARYDRARHYLYLTTPEIQPFQVTITSGTGGTIVDGNGNVLGPITISNAAPQVVYLGNGENPVNGIVTLTSTTQLNVALNNKGLRLTAPKLFYANFRARSSDQATSLTAKGKSAAGMKFRTGHIFNEIVPIPGWDRRSNFISLMATEDNTLVTISDYTAGMGLMSGAGDFYPSGPIQVNLMAGQSYVISTYVDITRPPENRNGFQGALVESTKPITVNCGSWLGSPYTDGLQDIGTDQIVPVDRVGTEYVTIRGDGPNELETPIVVATDDGTEVYINGNPVPIANLNAGDYLVVPPGSYTPQENLYIRATKPVYVYQMLGGANFKQTGGMNFVPPLGCSEGGSVDNIMDLNRIGNTTYEGKLIILAETGKPVYINGAAIPQGLFQPVAGKPEFVTIKVSGLTGNIKVDSDGPLQVGMYGRNDNAGWAGYFSGFDIVHRPEIEISISTYCGDTLFLSNLSNADSVIWFRNGQHIILKSDSILTGVIPGSYYALAHREFCDEVLWDTSAVIQIPEPLTFQVGVNKVTCPGIPSGSFSLYQLQGGYPPYLVSFDSGMTFTDTFLLDSLHSGLYSILIQDSLGCLYERSVFVPLEPNVPVIQLGLPDTINCYRDSVELSSLGSSTGQDLIYSWSSASGVPIPDSTSNSIFVQQPGVYYLEIINISNHCMVTDSIQVYDNKIAPDVTILSPSLISCTHKTCSISVQPLTGSTLNLDWSFQGTPLMTFPAPDSFIVSQPGMYSLLVTDPSNGCTNVFQYEIEHDTLPPGVSIPFPGNLDCRIPGVWLECLFVDTSDLQFTWKGPGVDSIASVNLQSIYALQPGHYSLTVIDTSNGCSTNTFTDIGQDTIAPIVDAGISLSLTCMDSIVSLQGVVTGCTQCNFFWNHPNKGILSGSTTLSPLVRDTGYYQLKAENQSNGCSTLDSVYINRIPPIKSFLLHVDPPTCEKYIGAFFIDHVEGGTPPYSCSFDGGISYGSAFMMDPAPEGVYTIMVRDLYGCTLQQSVEMIEKIPLDLQLEIEVTIEYGESYPIQLTTSLSPDQILSILWSPDSTLSCTTCLNPVASPVSPTTYKVIVIDKDSCQQEASIRVDVDFNAEVFIPNSFHPNGDGVNDGFTAFGDPDKVLKINQLDIYDRWGNAVFSTSNIPPNLPGLGWDGTFRNRPMDPAVFVYVIEVEFVNNTRATFKGDVLIVR